MYCFFRNRVWMDPNPAPGAVAEPAAAGEEAAGATAPPAAEPPEDGEEVVFSEAQQKAIESMLGKLGHKLGNQLKEKDATIAQLEKKVTARDEKLNELGGAEDLQRGELEELAREVQRKAEALDLKERQGFAMETVVGAGFAGELALAARDLVMGADNAAIEANTEKLQKLLKAGTEALVEQRFRAGGRTPEGGGGGGTSANYQKLAEEAQRQGDHSLAAYYMRLQCQQK